MATSRPDDSLDAQPSDSAGEGAGAKYPGKGFRIGEYVLDRVLGQGAMATVYLAHDASGNEVAVKLFVEGAGISTTMLERFRREAEASKKLRRHPHILTVYASGKEGPYHYIVMENIQRSKTLESALESTSLSIADVVLIIIKIARALQYAHARRILHRDVKPTNILIDEFGEPRLADFGVAAMVDWPSCTITGALTGTPLYMSPEQARTEKVTAASDIYSLGVVLYEALTGVLPYPTTHGRRVRDVLKAVTQEAPRRPRVYRKEISQDLEAVILKTLEKDPYLRYPTADELAADLERALMGRPVGARHFSAWDTLRHRIRRHRQALAVVGIVAAFAAGATIYFRNHLYDVQYESLIHFAQLQNAKYRLAQPVEPDPSPETIRAWQEIRRARQAMQDGEWLRAQRSLQSAVEWSTAAADARTRAIAKLEQARCAVMTYNQDGALHLYRDAFGEAAAGATIEAALVESLILFTLRGEVPDGAWQQAAAAVSPGFWQPLMAYLQGKPDAVETLPIREGTPADQSMAWLIAGIRAFVDGNQRESAMRLRNSMLAADPPTAWPAPFARMLRADLVR